MQNTKHCLILKFYWLQQNSYKLLCMKTQKDETVPYTSNLKIPRKEHFGINATYMKTFYINSFVFRRYRHRPSRYVHI